MTEIKPKSDSDASKQTVSGDTAADGNSAEVKLAEATAKEIEQIKLEVERYKDLYLRRSAEFENYKRRTEAEMNAITRTSNERLLLQILPIMDDFDRTFRSQQSNPDTTTMLKGIELIYQKLQKTLETNRVTQFSSEGMEFNVDLHDALMIVPRSDLPPNTIIEEIERGYMFGDKVLRHAKVIVSSEDTDISDSLDDSPIEEE